jgi:hypothetical protein
MAFFNDKIKLFCFTVRAVKHILQLVFTVDRTSGRAQAAFHLDRELAFTPAAVQYLIALARVAGAARANAFAVVLLVFRWSRHMIRIDL